MQLKLKEILANKNISYTELHKRTGISRNTITSLANGNNSMIRFVVIKKICDQLYITPNDLFGYSNKDSSIELAQDFLNWLKARD
ncbi:helix-turn-helix domain-containing protein [Companilactobacillus jidongensis]|uniref:helix-turn-helix domain-containing protein n=1 Tax=Companilactobacillus jidongensis TaxID=2486006 RepID=UPI000F7AE448|nr:helix-turn-helix transcriptional regulator [Companilactobacillus jidongensis]